MKQPGGGSGSPTQDLAHELARLAEREREGKLHACLRVRHAPGEWQQATLQNGFVNTAAGTAPVAYYRDELGRVYVRGRVNVPGSAVGPTTIFTLAVGFRPVYVHDFICISGVGFEGMPVFANAVVQPNGAVIFVGTSVEQMPLDVVQFRTL